VEADDTVRFTDLVVTEIGCPDPVGAQESAYLEILGGTVELAVDEAMLFVSGSAGRIEFEGRTAG
jgi:heat shock protein HslJ